MKRLKVKVSRRRWWRGHGPGFGKNYLRNTDGKMCCLGFACRVFGARSKDIVGQGMPRDVDTDLFIGTPLGNDKQITLQQLAHINDEAQLTASERERELKRIGKTIGIDFTFVP